jgi:hypothetical protein
VTRSDVLGSGGPWATSAGRVGKSSLDKDLLDATNSPVELVKWENAELPISQSHEAEEILKEEKRTLSYSSLKSSKGTRWEIMKVGSNFPVMMLWGENTHGELMPGAPREVEEERTH